MERNFQKKKKKKNIGVPSQGSEARLQGKTVAICASKIIVTLTITNIASQLKSIIIEWSLKKRNLEKKKTLFKVIGKTSLLFQIVLKYV